MSDSYQMSETPPDEVDFFRTAELYFEDRILPMELMALDCSSNYSGVENDEDTSSWFFTFQACAKRLRSSDSASVRLYCTRKLCELLRNEQSVMENLRDVGAASPLGEDPANTFKLWIEGLREMIDLSCSRRFCIWICGGPEERRQLEDIRGRVSTLPEWPIHALPPHLSDQHHSLKLNVESAEKELLKSERVFEANRNKQSKLEKKNAQRKGTTSS